MVCLGLTGNWISILLPNWIEFLYCQKVVRKKNKVTTKKTRNTENLCSICFRDAAWRKLRLTVGYWVNRTSSHHGTRAYAEETDKPGITDDKIETKQQIQINEKKISKQKKTANRRKQTNRFWNGDRRAKVTYRLIYKRTDRFAL